MIRINTIANSNDQYSIDKVNQVDDKFFYMELSLYSIKKINIKNFNYLTFEEDLDNMSELEFVEFFEVKIVDIIMNNEMLNISLDEVINETYRIKIMFTKNIIRFIMNTLPYVYMKQFLESEEIEGFHEALETFDDNLMSNIIKFIRENKSQYQNFSSLMTELEDTITNEKKRIKFSNKLSLLELSMEHKSKLLDYHESIITDSGNDGLKELFYIYLQQDLKNLI